MLSGALLRAGRCPDVLKQVTRMPFSSCPSAHKSSIYVPFLWRRDFAPLLHHSRSGVIQTLIPLLALSHDLEKQTVLLYFPHRGMVIGYPHLEG